MEKKKFRSLYDDLSHRVKEEGKKNPSWIMGYFQGLGNGTLTGYQAAALVGVHACLVGQPPWLIPSYHVQS